MQRMKKTIESTGTEFLVCFSSRPSSKTLMSPSHPSSLSLRLRSNGSLKSSGTASPIFPPSSRRKPTTSSIDAAAEPSSPKVTCIGQVKIKAKKKKKQKIKTSSSKKNKKKIVINRSRSVSEARLRKTVSICDALNCFVPSCGWSSCYYSTTTTSKREHEHEVLRRDDKIGKFVGLVVREEEVVERIEEKVLVFEEKVEEEEKGRVSVCIPPRNALLLMRCRSDPVRMAALSSRFWDSPAMRVQCEDDGVQVVEEDRVDEEKGEEGEFGDARVDKISLDEEEEVKSEAHVEEEEEKVVEVDKVDKEEEEEEEEEEVILAEPVKDVEERVEETMLIEERVQREELKEEVFCEDGGEEVEIVLRRSISCSAPKSQDLIKATEGRRRSFSYREKKEKWRHSFSTEEEARRHSFCSEKEARRSSFSVDKEGRRRWNFLIEKENLGPKEKPVGVQSVVEPTKKEEPVKAVEPIINEVRETIKVSKVEAAQVVGEREKKSRELPDCLLLMMYEPKLSMEVSKETWVCSTDFVHWRPRQANQPTEPKAEEKCEEVKNANAAPIVEQTPSKPTLAVSPIEQKIWKLVEQTPPKPMQTVSPIEQKVLKNSAVGALPQVPYEQHFVLTRCKSEPAKSSARLMPDRCFWKSRHQPIGTAGIGF